MTAPPAAASRSWPRRLLGDALRHRRLSLAVAATAVAATGLTAAPPLVMRSALDDAVAGRADRVATFSLTLAAVAVVVFAGSFLRQLLASRLALTVQHDLRTEVFASLQRLDGARQDNLRTGQVMSRANVDLQMVQGFLGQVPAAVGSVVLLVVAFAAMTWISPLLTLVQVAMVAVSALVTVVSSRRLSPATWAVQHRNAVLAQIVTETVAGAYTVKGFGQEQRESARFAEQSAALYGERLRVARLQSQPMATLQSLPMLAQIAVLLLGGALAVRGALTLGDFVAFAAFTTTLTGPAAVLSNLVVAGQLTAPAATRVYELLDTTALVTEPADPDPVPAGPLGLRLRGVSFGYVPDEPVLADLDLEVAAGETVAVVGPSGSGKSTLALLLPRFYDPQAGTIELVGPDAQVDLRRLRPASLRRAVGVVFEEPFLFAGSVADNLRYGHPDAEEEAVVAAATTAGAAEFIVQLPDGYASEVSERGGNLSGGQRQRLALARMLLADPSVLVLDDATSAVDAATASEVTASLRQAAAGRTTVLIAHRRASLAFADRIVVLEAGRVVDQGTMAELLQRCPLFVELFGEAGTAAAAQALDLTGAAPHPALWPDVGGATSDASARVVLDGMEVESDQLRRVAELPAASARPPARLARGDGPPPRTLLGVLAPLRGAVLVAVLLMAADAAVTSAVPALIQQGVDRGVSPGDLRTVVLLAAVAGALVLVNWAVLYAQPRMITRTGEGAMYAVRVRSFRHLHSLGLQHFEGQRGGALLTRMTTDVTSLADFVESGLTVAVVNVLTVGVMAAAMVVIDPGLAVTAFAVLPVLALATLVFRRLSHVAYEQARDQTGAVNEDLQENLAGLRTTQASGQEAGARERFGGLSETLRRIRLRASAYAAAYFPFVGLLSDVATLLVLVVGVRRVAEQELTAGVLTAFLLYLGLFFAPFQQLSMVFDGYQRARVGVRRVAELLTTPATVTSPPDARPVPGRLRGELVLRQVGFRYPDAARLALADVDLVVPAGTRLALVGATGSGKSTVVKVVGRFFDVDRGAVLVDGHDVRSYDLQAFRRRLGVAPQEPSLFAGTVADNIRYARPDADDAAVEAAAAAVGALPVVAALPHGFCQQVGEEGRGLSAGQAQLVALARVWLADPDILLLDEPTAALDLAGERDVLDAMEAVSAPRTTVLVTHRLATAARCEQIAVLDGGRVLESGSHDELLAAGGAYRRLWSLEHPDDPDLVAEHPDPDLVAGRSGPAHGSVARGAVLVRLVAMVSKLLVALRLARPTPPSPTPTAPGGDRA